MSFKFLVEQERLAEKNILLKNLASDSAERSNAYGIKIVRYLGVATG